MSNDYEDPTMEPGTYTPEKSFEGTPEIPHAMRHYYVNRDNQIVQHFAEDQGEIQGFSRMGKSQLAPLAAAGFYTKNEPGYTVQDGDAEKAKKEEENANED